MALHSPKTCVYFGSSRSLFSLFWQNMIICVAFFFGNDELPSQALTEKVTSTTLFSLFNPSSCSHLFEIKGLLQCVFENLKLVIFHIWKNLYGLASILFFVLWGMERLTDTCVVTELAGTGWILTIVHIFFQTLPILAGKSLHFLQTQSLMINFHYIWCQKNGKTSNLNATKLAIHLNLIYFNASVLTLANQRISLGWSSTTLLLCWDKTGLFRGKKSWWPEIIDWQMPFLSPTDIRFVLTRQAVTQQHCHICICL